MKCCKKVIILCCFIAGLICTARIVWINRAFPNAQEISYTADNTADINGLVFCPAGVRVCTMEEYEEISDEYNWMSDEYKMKSRVVVMDLSVENVTDDVINFYPGMFIFVAEGINGSNGVSSVNQGETHIIFLPNETKQIQLQALLCPGQISEKKLDKIESSTLTLVYSFYPYRRKIVFG